MCMHLLQWATMKHALIKAWCCRLQQGITVLQRKWHDQNHTKVKWLYTHNGEAGFDSMSMSVQLPLTSSPNFDLHLQFLGVSSFYMHIYGCMNSYRVEELEC